MTLLIIGLIFAYFQMQKLSNQLNKVNLNPEVKTEVIQDTVLVNKLLKELEGLKTKLTSTKITIPVETVTTNIPIPIEEKDTTYSIYQKPYKISANYLWASRQLKLEVIRDSLIIYNKVYIKDNRIHSLWYTSDSLDFLVETEIDPFLYKKLNKKDNFKWFLGIDALRYKSSGILGVQYRFIQSMTYITKDRFGLIIGVIF